MEQKKIKIKDNTHEFIASLLQEYKLKESVEELVKKIGQKKTPNGRKLALVVLKIANGKISQEEAIVEIQQGLSLSRIDAQKITNELINNALESAPKTNNKVLKKSVQQINTKKISQKENKNDTYREPVQ